MVSAESCLPINLYPSPLLLSVIASGCCQTSPCHSCSLVWFSFCFLLSSTFSCLKNTCYDANLHHICKRRNSLNGANGNIYNRMLTPEIFLYNDIYNRMLTPEIFLYNDDNMAACHSLYNSSDGILLPAKKH